MVLEPKLRLLQSRSRSNHSLPRLRKHSTLEEEQENQKNDSYITRRYTFAAKDNDDSNSPQHEIIRQRFSTKAPDKNDSSQYLSTDRKGRRKSSISNSILAKYNYQETPTDCKLQQRQCSSKSTSKKKRSSQDQSILPTLNQLHLVQQRRYADDHSHCSYDAEDEYDSHNDDGHQSISGSSSGGHQLTLRNLQMIDKCNKTDEVEMGYDSGINENTSPPEMASQTKLLRHKKKFNDHQPQYDKMTTRTRILDWLNDCKEKEDEHQLPILLQSQLTNYRC